MFRQTDRTNEANIAGAINTKSRATTAHDHSHNKLIIGFQSMPPKSDEMAALGFEMDHPYAAACMMHDPSAPEMKHSLHGTKRLPPNEPRMRRPPKNGETKYKAVGFVEEEHKTVEVEHMDDLPAEFIWYSREEYDEIKGRNSQIVKLIKCGEFEENDQYSCRGLEHKLKEVFRQRRANKFNALNAVLEEQDRQINRGIIDPHLISAAYQTVSVRCQESANTIALRDYRFSLNYDPNKPASGKPKPATREDGTNATPNSPTKDKKKKKKEKKEEKKEKKEAKKEKKDKDKHHKDKNKQKEKDHHHKDKDKDKNLTAHADDDDSLDSLEGELSPKSKKKGGVRKVARGARRMMRRMSM